MSEPSCFGLSVLGTNSFLFVKSVWVGLCQLQIIVLPGQHKAWSPTGILLYFWPSITLSLPVEQLQPAGGRSLMKALVPLPRWSSLYLKGLMDAWAQARREGGFQHYFHSLLPTEANSRVFHGSPSPRKHPIFPCVHPTGIIKHSECRDIPKGKKHMAAALPNAGASPLANSSSSYHSATSFSHAHRHGQAQSHVYTYIYSMSLHTRKYKHMHSICIHIHAYIHIA
jgi:hypothetical protein